MAEPNEAREQHDGQQGDLDNEGADVLDHHEAHGEHGANMEDEVQEVEDPEEQQDRADGDVVRRNGVLPGRAHRIIEEHHQHPLIQFNDGRQRIHEVRDDNSDRDDYSDRENDLLWQALPQAEDQHDGPDNDHGHHEGIFLLTILKKKNCGNDLENFFFGLQFLKKNSRQ